jgi:hypothetical protein
MIYLVAAETLVLVLLAVLVVGLLRSHAEILRRLPAEGEAPEGEDFAPELQVVEPPDRDDSAPEAPDIAGQTLQGDAVKIALRDGAPRTLIAFLSSGCATCQEFWDALQPSVREPLPGGARLIVVTKDGSHESPAKLRELAPPDVPVVLSSDTWEAFSVPVAPYFVYVGSNGTLLGEGSAAGWSQIVSLFRDALLDAGDEVGDEAGGGRRRVRRTPRAEERLREEDRILAAAGIGPGHPSLYPKAPPTEDQAPPTERPGDH